MSRDTGASIRQRLLNEANRRNRPFQEMLQYFATERLLYRLSLHPLADRFVLNGALLMTAWKPPISTSPEEQATTKGASASGFTSCARSRLKKTESPSTFHQLN